jgi:ferric-dicitrate binding protein FerR (iron transport regulator)
MSSEWTDLFAEALSETPAPERRKELEDLLTRDAEARRAWREYVNLHVGLKAYCAMPGALAAPAPAVRRRRWILPAAAAAIFVALGLYAWRPPSTLGRVTQISGARWGSAAPGATVGPGRLDLVSGFAEITLTNGVRLVLESPATIDLESIGRARLERGRVVAHVPPEGRGFTVDTNRARLVDLGTEFGVGIRENGETEVQVFLGEVIAECKDTTGATRSHRLEAGKAVSIAGSPEAIPFEPDRFVRMFPTENSSGQPAGPMYNRSRFNAVRVLPAPPGLTIDGDLSDWDRGGAFKSACWPPYHESHTLEGLMMYDDRFLYVAARVGDPAPLRSVMDPTAQPGRHAWSGGSVIVRLVAAPDVGWPFHGKGRALADQKTPDAGRRPQDVDERITHLTFWHHAPTGKARLHVSHGMDFHGERVDPEGWSGAFRARADGLGYTLEYAIPWTLLNAGSRPPRPGDVLPSSWTVHWSDHEGKESRGHLVEIVNQDDPPYRFLRGATWGKAVFEGAPRPR